MMELAMVKGAARVAMGVDMDHSHRRASTHCLQDGLADGVIAANRERHHARIDDLGEALLDVLVAHFKVVATAQRHVADICNAKIEHRRRLQDVIIWANPLYRPQGARPETRSGPVRYAQIHRHPGYGHLQVTSSGFSASTCLNGAERNVGTPA
jgi:hypothetical protein